MSYLLDDIIAPTGRVNTLKLTSYINKVDRQAFALEARHPFLVARKLYEGTLSQQRQTSNTMIFNINDIKEYEKSKMMGKTFNTDSAPTQDDSSINLAIFALRKQGFSKKPSNYFTVGRVQPNDLIIADYTISKNHACIIADHGNYFLKDEGSTNGTHVASEKLGTENALQILPYDVITFGRIGYIFVPPQDLYDALKT